MSSPSCISLPGSLRRHSSLIWQFTLRTVDIRHKGSFLGIFWSVLNPLLLLGLYTFVFGTVMNNRFGVQPGETEMDFALGVFLGLTIYSTVMEIFGIAPSIIVSQPNLVKKVVFPLEILPLANVLAAFYHFGISLALCLLGVALLGSGLPLRALWLVFLLPPLFALSLGLAWLLSALGVYFRDLAQVTGFLATALFYASAIFYSPQQIPENVRGYFELNPMLIAVDEARRALLWDLPPQSDNVLYLYGVCILLLLAGYWTFRRLKNGFADVV